MVREPEHREAQVKVGQGWWTGVRPIWLVDGIEHGRAILARWRPVEGGVEREERRIELSSLLMADGGWRTAPDELVEEMQAEIAAGRVA